MQAGHVHDDWSGAGGEVEHTTTPDSGELRSVKITGDFYKETETTFTLTLKDYGKSVQIDEPSS